MAEKELSVARELRYVLAQQAEDTPYIVHLAYTMPEEIWQKARPDAIICYVTKVTYSLAIVDLCTELSKNVHSGHLIE